MAKSYTRRSKPCRVSSLDIVPGGIDATHVINGEPNELVGPNHEQGIPVLAVKRRAAPLGARSSAHMTVAGRASRTYETKLCSRQPCFSQFCQGT